MGIISKIFGRKNDPEKENAHDIYNKFSSYGITNLSEDQIYRILKGTKEEYRARFFESEQKEEKDLGLA